MSTYALVLFYAGIGPLILSFFPALKFYRNLRALFLSIGITILLFGSWDVFATWRGHWHFDPKSVWGIYILNLPLEEWLFFIVIPFCCIFTWEAINYLSRKLK